MNAAQPGSIPLKPINAECCVIGHGPRTPAKSKLYAEGRACTTCERPLSIYNPDALCGPCLKATPVDERPSIRNYR